MVSFSCETCGDVLTKKKLDAHHRQCQGSTFTCLDCMIHFRGTDYRSHTSCITEDQKYQGALYQEKPPKRSVKKLEQKQRPRSVYVEDAPDIEVSNAIAIVDAPPAAPTPPSTKQSKPPQPAPPVNVFDFLESKDTPKATPHATPNPLKGSKGPPEESMQIVDMVPKNPTNGVSHKRKEGSKIVDQDVYEKRGYTYGEEPVPVPPERPTVEYITPGPKHRRNDSHISILDAQNSQQKSTDKKRKRVHVEELDLATARRPSQEPDLDMSETPPAILHSGLTGGLNRLLSKSTLPPSPDYSNRDPSPPSPQSPVKRSKPTLNGKSEGVSRGRNGALVKVRKRRSSDESRPRKHQRSHHNPDHRNSTRPQQAKFKAVEDRPKRKAIEYHSQNHAAADEARQKQLVVYNSRAELFMSFVTKGPDSEQGYSMHKALKRYHRERGERGLAVGKVEDEKELFKGLRLKRNERGEIVVFF